ncbi:MAG: hypothetical protein ABH807_00295 [Candidatus Shapirobacteria bacterium]
MKAKSWSRELILVLVIALAAFVFLWRLSPDFYRLSWRRPMFMVTDSAVSSEALTLKQLFAGNYHEQRVVVEGKLEQSPAVCPQAECPADDRCCTCPDKVNLQMSDQYLLQLDAFCFRNDCGYDCGDWQKGKNYQVTGFLKVAWPNQYFLKVESKKLLAANFLQSLTETMAQLTSQFKDFFKPGDFVIR